MPALDVDTVIIGGGLLGWSAAYPLVKAGQRVALVDRTDEGHATQAGAGIIAPGMNLRDPEADYPLLVAAVGYSPRLVELLTSDAEQDTGYETAGALFVARDDEEAATLPALAQTMARQRDAGLGNIGELTLLDAAGARQAFPAVGGLCGARYAAAPARGQGRIPRRAPPYRTGAEGGRGGGETNGELTSRLLARAQSTRSGAGRLSGGALWRLSAIR